MNKTLLLIPHYNNQEGLKKSIRSICAKEKIDILVVDDGSSNSLDEVLIIKGFKAQGSIFFQYLGKNKGIEHALNFGLEIACNKKYKFLARLDCGDTIIGSRFEIQEQFLEKNDIALVGSNVNFVNEKGEVLYKVSLPTTDTDIRKKMYLNAMHIHPSIMFKIDIIKKIGGYPTNYRAAEDYAFFFKVLKEYKVANLNEFLVNCEYSTQGISSIFRKEQVKSRMKIILDNFYFGWYPIYGLIRSLVLYITPNDIIIFLKRILKSGKKTY